VGNIKMAIKKAANEAIGTKQLEKRSNWNKDKI